MTEVLETGGAGQTGRGSGLCQNQQRGKKRVIMDHCKMPSQVLTLSF